MKKLFLFLFVVLFPIAGFSADLCAPTNGLARYWDVSVSGCEETNFSSVNSPKDSENLCCSVCPSGSFCSGSEYTTGSFGDVNINVMKLDCTTPGTYCPAGSAAETPCPAGSFCPNSTTKNPCTPGNYCPAGAVAETPCDAGKYCPNSGMDAPTPCPAYYDKNTATGQSLESQCMTICGPGFAVQTPNARCAIVSGNFYSAGQHNVYYGDTSATYTACAPGYEITGTASGDHDEESDCAISCAAGSAVVAPRAGCTDTADGTWSIAHKVPQGRLSTDVSDAIKTCPAGYTPPNGGSDTVRDSENKCYIKCAAGTYRPGATDGTCTACPVGVDCVGMRKFYYGVAQTFPCGAGYWGSGNNDCARCPLGGKSAKGSTRKEDCYIPAGAKICDKFGCIRIGGDHDTPFRSL